MSDDFNLPKNLGLEILRSEVGSTLHGTGLGSAHEDYDEMGIFLELPRTTIGLGGIDHWIKRSKPEGVRSEAGDTDLVLYSARKWAKLALNGNPSVLLLLHSPDNRLTRSSVVGDDLRAHAQWFASKRAGRAFLGYMQRQRMRMTGERGRAGRVRVMPDGQVDWKYAMHMLRLGYQGIEYLSTGHITLPMPEEQAHELRLVRKGLMTMETVLGWAEDLEEQLKRLLDGGSPLPDEPNTDKVEQWLIARHLEFWGDQLPAARRAVLPYGVER